jgi:hypothetical protein
MTFKPLLVGEDNPYSADPRYALYFEPPQSAGGRLQRLIIGCSGKEYIRDFDRVNLCPAKWSMAVARESAMRLRREREQHDVNRAVKPVVILLGQKVANAFNYDYRFPYSPMLAGDVYYIMLPHPSGRSRVWNDINSFITCKDMLKKVGIDYSVTW